MPKFKRFATQVWDIDPAGKSDEDVAAAGVEALADFIREIGLPTSFREMGIPDDTDLAAIASSTNLTAGCCKKLSREAVLQIFQEAMG